MIVAILVISGTLSALTAGLLPSGGGPDEREHYSYVQHLARNPLPFPPRLEEIFTGDSARPNHLMHPPAYHYLMAAAYRTLQVDRQLTGVGREADEFGLITSHTIIPTLRMASLPLVALHLLGLYRLLQLLVHQQIVPAWTAIPIAAASSWAPAAVFISGTLNNDVLIRALWPWIVLVIAQYFFTGHPTYFWGAVSLISVSVLTKGTFWPFAASAAITALVVMWKGRTEHPTGTLRPLQVGYRGRWTNRLPPALAIFLAGSTLWYLGTMLIRYGSIQPGYTTVFGIPVTESQFYRARIAEREDNSLSTVVAAIRNGIEDLVGSFIGVMGQEERILPLDAGPETQLLLGLAVLSLALAIWASFQSSRSARSLVGIALIGTAFVFALTYVTRSWRTFLVLGNFGAQGRYLIGYIDVWLIGSVALGWQFVSTRSSKATCIAYTSALVMLLLTCTALLARPMHYFNNSVQIHDRVGVERVVREQAEEAGLTLLSFEPVPASTVARIPTSRSGHILPAEAWSLPNRDAILQAPLRNGVPGRDCLFLQLHVRSEGTGRLEVGTADERLTEDPGSLQTTSSIAVRDGVEVVHAFVPYADGGALWLRPSANSDQLDVLQAFSGTAPCP